MNNLVLNICIDFELVASATICAAGESLANFLNSELYGIETSVPWAVKFIKIDNIYTFRY